MNKRERERCKRCMYLHLNTRSWTAFVDGRTLRGWGYVDITIARSSFRSRIVRDTSLVIAISPPCRRGISRRRRRHSRTNEPHTGIQRIQHRAYSRTRSRSARFATPAVASRHVRSTGRLLVAGAKVENVSLSVSCLPGRHRRKTRGARSTLDHTDR